MSEVLLNVLDSERAIHGRVHGSTADRLVASLGADPATIEDLEIAFGRFEQHVHGQSVFGGFRPGLDPEPWDAGIVYIDLAARLVAGQSTYSTFSLSGAEYWHDGEQCTDKDLPFRLADDWLLLDDVDGFELRSRQRHAARSAQQPIDERAVLYGRLPEHLVKEVWGRRNDLSSQDDDARYQFVQNVHAAWLLTPREDLRGKSPREVMIDDRHEHIDHDMQNQQMHWSFLRQPPPGIRRESMAYQFAGFGRHEIVLYYDLVRELLFECVSRMKRPAITKADLPAEAEHLQQHRQEWLNTPNYEDLSGRTPASVIDRERRRMPEAACGDEAIIDPDCPMCQMMADEEMFGPAFWCLDGSSMDDEFAFSFFRTREEWEEEKRSWEEWNREYERRRKENGEDSIEDDVPW